MLEMLIPIIALMLTGVLFKKINFISDKTVAGIKKVLVNVCLPVLIFNVLGTAKFTKDSIVLFSISAITHLTVFALGFLIIKFVKVDYKKYIPFFIIGFEGGMMGYALMGTLVSESDLKYLATMDLAGALFSFTIWVTLLGRLNSEAKTKKETIMSMVKSPTLVAAVTGLIVGLTGLGNMLVASPAGNVYERCVEYFTAPMTPMILICLGYGLSFSKDVILDALKLIGTRIVMIGIVAGILVFSLTRFIDMTPVIWKSIAIFFFLPPSFLLSVYIEDKKTLRIVSCALSIYILITLIAYAVVGIL